jgi:hypothetical protein
MEPFSTYWDIKQQNMGIMPSFLPLITQGLPDSIYCDIKAPDMESKPKFQPNPNLKLMDQDAYRTQGPVKVVSVHSLRVFDSTSRGRARRFDERCTV